MSNKEAKINAWLKQGANSLLDFRRSPFHDTLRSAPRDHYTNLFENYEDGLLASVERLLRGAKVREPHPISMSNSRAIEGCWELQTHDDPKTITINGYQDYAYRFVPIVLTADLMGEREVIRHLCHNRACVCPDHLVIGTYQQNKQDETERVYSGRGPKGDGQSI
jgi:hypothetical protein